MLRLLFGFGMIWGLLAASCLFVQAQGALTEIVYSSWRGGRSEIYRMRADGSGKINLSRDPTAIEYMPSWSPDARKIVYVRESAPGGIYIMNADGSQKTVIPFGGGGGTGSNPVFSPDGSKIIFSRFLGSEQGEHLFSVNLDGTNLTRLTFNSRDNRKASFSPDGARIVFDTNPGPNFNSGQIFTMNPTGGALAAVVLDNYNTRPDWSPDGSKIAFTSAVQASPQLSTEIYVVNADGSNKYRVTDGLTNNAEETSAAWSPDGSQIAFTSTRNGQEDIYVVSSSGGGVPVRLTFSDALEFSLDWSSRPVAPASVSYDFDYDGKADQAVFRPDDGVWYLLRSSLGFAAAQFGLGSDKIVPADFDGDGKTDIGVFRDGVWYWLNSANGTFSAAQFGQAGDKPLPFDYSGDKRAELAVYRDGYWYTLNLANNEFQAVKFGIATDKTVPADYDGDGKIDFAVFRDGTWYWLKSSDNDYRAVQFGVASDQPVVGDYDGDGRADPTVYRAGVWYVLAGTQGFYGVPFGAAGDTPVAADYDGDGKTDIGVFRDGIWNLLRSQQGSDTVRFGAANDKPVAAAFLP